jgi:hypothetical protein
MGMLFDVIRIPYYLKELMPLSFRQKELDEVAFDVAVSGLFGRHFAASTDTISSLKHLPSKC